MCDHDGDLPAQFVPSLSQAPGFEVYRCQCGALVNIVDEGAQHCVFEAGVLVHVVSDPMTAAQITSAVQAAIKRAQEVSGE